MAYEPPTGEVARSGQSEQAETASETLEALDGLSGDVPAERSEERPSNDQPPYLRPSGDESAVAESTSDTPANDEAVADELFGGVFPPEKTAAQEAAFEPPAEPTPVAMDEEKAPAITLPWETPGLREPTLAGDAAKTDATGDDADVPRAGEAKLPAANPAVPAEPWEPAASPASDADNISARLGRSATAIDQNNSRQKVWLLASKLSYSLLASSELAEQAAGDVERLAGELGIALPETPELAGLDAERQARLLLDLGRELGDVVARRYGAHHAALVEVAFKSNMLLVIYDARPHLKHAVNGAVSAAAVRAGLPDPVWQDWQDRIADSQSRADVEQAVVELHTRIGEAIVEPARPVSDFTPAMLR